MTLAKPPLLVINGVSIQKHGRMCRQYIAKLSTTFFANGIEMTLTWILSSTDVCLKELTDLLTDDNIDWLMTNLLAENVNCPGVK